MRTARRLGLLLVLAAPFAPACRSEAKPAPDASRHPVRGRVVKVDQASRTLTLAHEDIPGFMPAMTMEFVVLEKDAPLLALAHPGDEVTAVLVVPDSRYWLEQLVVVKKAASPPPGASPAAGARGAEPGDLVPDVALVDQDGRGFRLSSLRGEAVALTFVFSRCPLPEYCPLLMRNFAAVEATLVADARLRERTRLVTISFDTRHDTPAVLRAFGLPFQKTTPPFAHWRLATGSDEAIRTLGAALELDYVEETASFTHNLRTAVVDPAGRLRLLLRGNEWKPEELVAALRQAAGG
jgi:protein SCO1/2